MEAVRCDFKPMSKRSELLKRLIGEGDAVFAESIKAHASENKRRPTGSTLDVMVATPDCHFIPQFFLCPAEVYTRLANGDFLGFLLGHGQSQLGDSLVECLDPMCLNDDFQGSTCAARLADLPCQNIHAPEPALDCRIAASGQIVIIRVLH